MQRPHFFSWYRISLFSVLGVICAISLAAPLMVMSAIKRFAYPVHHAELIQSAAQRYHVDPYLICAVIHTESGWDAGAHSKAGAVGLMQIMPATAQFLADGGQVSAREYPLTRLQQARENIEYGTAYLAYLQSQFSSRDEVIAAYNAGPTTVGSWKKKQDRGVFADVVEYVETKNYIIRVNQAYDAYKELYPDGIHD